MVKITKGKTLKALPSAPDGYKRCPTVKTRRSRSAKRLLRALKARLRGKMFEHRGNLPLLRAYAKQLEVIEGNTRG